MILTTELDRTLTPQDEATQALRTITKKRTVTIAYMLADGSQHHRLRQLRGRWLCVCRPNLAARQGVSVAYHPQPGEQA